MWTKKLPEWRAFDFSFYLSTILPNGPPSLTMGGVTDDNGELLIFYATRNLYFSTL